LYGVLIFKFQNMVTLPMHKDTSKDGDQYERVIGMSKWRIENPKDFESEDDDSKLIGSR
jgi:hypothetical protein